MGATGPVLLHSARTVPVQRCWLERFIRSAPKVRAVCAGALVPLCPCQLLELTALSHPLELPGLGDS